MERIPHTFPLCVDLFAVETSSPLQQLPSFSHKKTAADPIDPSSLLLDILQAKGLQDTVDRKNKYIEHTAQTCNKYYMINTINYMFIKWYLMHLILLAL